MHAQTRTDADTNNHAQVLQQAQAQRKQLEHADQTVRELAAALQRAQLASLAQRKATMHQRAKLGRREYTLEQRIVLLRTKLEAAEEARRDKDEQCARDVADAQGKLGVSLEQQQQLQLQIQRLLRQHGEGLDDRKGLQEKLVAHQVGMECVHTRAHAHTHTHTHTHTRHTHR